MKWIIGIGVCLLVLLMPPNAYSCSCADVTPHDAFENSRAVFTAQFVSYVSTNPRRGRQRDKVKLKVGKLWKGDLSSEVTLPYFDMPGMCGDIRFVRGRRYLIYATEYNGGLIIVIDCNRNREIKYATEDLKYLARR
jgi:hypothetical protein